MPLTYTIDPERRLVTIAGDYVDAVQWRVLAEQLVSDPRLAPGFGFIRDIRDSVHPASAPTVLAAFDVVQRFWDQLQPRKAAIVARRNDAAGANMAQALGDTHQLPIRAFDSYDAAVEWLNDASAASPESKG